MKPAPLENYEKSYTHREIKWQKENQKKTVQDTEQEQTKDAAVAKTQVKPAKVNNGRNYIYLGCPKRFAQNVRQFWHWRY